MLLKPFLLNLFDTFFTVTFWRKTIDKNSIKVGDKSIKVGDKSIKVGDKDLEKVGDELTKNQKAMLNYMKKNKKMSANQLSKKIGISQRKIEENILKLKNKKRIKRVGSPKSGHWVVFD